MKLDYSLLKTIHRILKQKTDLTERIEKGPRQVRVAQNAEQQFVADLEQIKESRTKAKMAADEKQLQLSEREAKIENFKAKLNTAESNKEFQLLKDQIAADEQANAVLSDEILEMLERLDVLDEEVAQAESNLQTAKQETEKVRKRIEQESASLHQQLESVLADLAANESKLTGDVGAEYRRLVEGRGEDALAETDMQTCGQCYTKLTTQKMSELMMRVPVFCPSCGCLLYCEENQTAAN